MINKFILIICNTVASINSMHYCTMIVILKTRDFNLHFCKKFLLYFCTGKLRNRYFCTLFFIFKFQNEIQYHMIGEQPIRIGDTAFISAVGGVFQYKDIATLDIDQSRIVLPKQVFTPQGLQNLTKMQSTSGITAHGHLTPIASEKCVRVEFIKYLTNPYQHVQKGSLLVSG